MVLMDIMIGNGDLYSWYERGYWWLIEHAYSMGHNLAILEIS